MGIFDKFKKKKEYISETEKATETKLEDGTVANNGCRFTFMVEDVFSIKEQGIIVVGFVKGRVSVGDAYYLYHPSEPIGVGMIEGMESAPRQMCSTAENQHVAIKIGNMKKENVPCFTVLSSIRPQTLIDVNKAVENPQLLGLMSGYDRFCENVGYMNILIYQIVHAKFLLAMYVDKELDQNDNGIVTFNENTTIGFPTVTSNDNKSAVPVFTDWTALAKWTNVFSEQHLPKTAINSFQDVVCISSNGNDGIVINPFGKNPIFLSNDMITKIVNAEGYRKEFGEGKGSKVKSYTVEKDTKVRIGLPKETEEVILIKDALISFGAANKLVKEIYFFLKIQNGEYSYFCIMDIPKDNANKIFEEVHKAVAPMLLQGHVVDYTIKSNSFADIMKEYGPVYTENNEY